MLIFSIIISFSIFFLTIRAGNFFKLYDEPKQNKKHKKPTLYIGGIAIFLTHVFLINIFDVKSEFNVILYSGVVFIILGLIDDYFNLNHLFRLLIQILFISLIITYLDLRVEYLGNYHFFGDIIISNPLISKIFTILCVVLLINAFNFVDGIDILAGLLFLIFLIFSHFYAENFTLRSLFLISTPILIFLFYNNNLQKKNKIFLGNNGSYYLGYLMSFLSIYFSQSKEINLNPNYTIWILSYIVFDFLSVLILRIKNNKNIMLTDKSHMHDILLKKSKKQLFVLFQISLIIIFLSLVPFMLAHYKYLSLYVYIIFFIFFNVLKLQIKKK